MRTRSECIDTGFAGVAHISIDWQSCDISIYHAIYGVESVVWTAKNVREISWCFDILGYRRDLRDVAKIWTFFEDALYGLIRRTWSIVYIVSIDPRLRTAFIKDIDTPLSTLIGSLKFNRYTELTGPTWNPEQVPIEHNLQWYSGRWALPKLLQTQKPCMSRKMANEVWKLSESSQCPHEGDEHSSKKTVYAESCWVGKWEVVKPMC